ncbi:hypothetical protein [Streptomyces sp. NPDC001492]
MSLRLIVWTMLVPGLVGIAVMGAILWPVHDNIPWPRLLVAGAAMAAVQLAGGALGGFLVGYRHGWRVLLPYAPTDPPPASNSDREEKS